MGEEPRLSHPVSLAFRGDWGQANFHRIFGWLSQEMGDRAPEGSEFAIWNGRGGRDQIEAVRAGKADISILTPIAALPMLKIDDLYTLGTLPQRDRLVVAVDAALPVNTVADLANLPGRVTIATSPDDGVNLVGYAVHKALRLAGVDPQRHRFRYAERAFPLLSQFINGEADVLIHEAIMTPQWHRIDSKRPVRYLPWGDHVLAAFAAEGWPSATVEAGYLPGLEEDLRTLEFSDFAMICPRTLADDVAYLAVWCMVKTRLALEAMYAHIPPERAPITYPLVPADMARSPIPYHPAAARAYAELDDTPITDGLMWG